MITPIKNGTDYEKALARIDALMDNDENPDELEILSILVEKYEEEHFPIDTPDPVEAIKFRMEQMGLSNKDIAKTLGGANRASEILNRKRSLTIRMIKNLHNDLDIPYEALIGE